MRANSFFNHAQPHKKQYVMDLKIENLLSQIFICESELNRNGESLIRVEKFFGHDELWPDQCDYAIQTLDNMHLLIKKLNRLLDDFLSAPIDRKDNRYTILVKTHYLDKEISDLISRIGFYREICQTNERDKNGEHNKIVAKLEKTREIYLSLKHMLENIVVQSRVSTCVC